MLHFIYFSTNISTEYFKHAAHSPFLSSKCHLFHNVTFFFFFIIHILHTGVLKLNVKFKVCKSVQHRTIQINHQPDATVFSLLSWRLFTAQHVSGVFRPSSGARLQWQPLVSPSYRGDSRAVFVVGPAGRPARPRTQHAYHHDTKVKPEAATAIVELLMMGGKAPETCWAVNKRQVINWKIVASGWWFIWIKCKTPVPKG
jgi:hypothetical protein